MKVGKIFNKYSRVDLTDTACTCNGFVISQLKACNVYTANQVHNLDEYKNG